MRKIAIGMFTMAVGSMLALSAFGDTSARAKPVTSLQVGSLSIGSGQPRIIVSTSGKGVTDTLDQAQRIAKSRDADMLEFRIDTLEFATDAAQVTELGWQIVQVLQGKPLLLTFRTKGEGGKRQISDDEYATLYSSLIKADFANIIDVEMYRGEARVRTLIRQAHSRGIPVILSSHELENTPSTSAMTERLLKQESLGADVLKLAVTPRDGTDVARLLMATTKVRQRSDRPLLTMAMGGMGTISRMAGETFGSNLTFGALGQASAPGQLDAHTLRAALDGLHEAN